MTQPNQPPSYPTQPHQPHANQPPSYQMPSYPSPFDGPPPAPVDRPATLTNAVRLMFAGAAVSLIGLLYNVVTFDSQMSEVTAKLKNMPNMTPEIINMAHSFALTTAIFSAVVGILLWLWMAWKNHQGRRWARIVGTVLAGFSILSVPVSWAQSAANGMQIGVMQMVLPLIILAIGITAAVLMWLRPSSEYYAFQSRQRKALR
ncbi:MAG: hypothetical protein M3017_14995 [Actinomycetota bacterium]|nr:hypothetical protein [Actinomycetota bacterium]